MKWRAVAMLGLILAGSVPATVWAEDAAKALPTLMIKGEVVSLDTADSNAVLIKVRDRYGFETPIFLGSDTKIQQGESTVGADQLAVGSQVDVEYNFDVNTAKRHAVSVKLQGKAAAPAPAATTSTDAGASTAPAQTTAPAAQTPAPASNTAPAAASGAATQ